MDVLINSIFRIYLKFIFIDSKKFKIWMLDVWLIVIWVIMGFVVLNILIFYFGEVYFIVYLLGCNDFYMCRSVFKFILCYKNKFWKKKIKKRISDCLSVKGYCCYNNLIFDFWFINFLIL